MQRTILQACSALAVGLTVAAVTVTVTTVEPADPVAGTTLLVEDDIVVSSDGGFVPDHEELAMLGEVASDRAVARRDADAAAVLLDDLKATRGLAVERATRDAERVALEQAAAAQAAEAERLASADPRALGQVLAADWGWSGEQWSCLDSLWQRESNWEPTARNPSSGAYGIPQALPGAKMASAGSDWESNPATQITWGLGYIADRYGTPCGAWGHSESVGWY